MTSNTQVREALEAARNELRVYTHFAKKRDIHIDSAIAKASDHLEGINLSALESAPDVERVRGALEPFARLADKLDDYKGAQPDRLVQMGVTAEMCLAARAALSPAPAAPSGSLLARTYSGTLTEQQLREMPREQFDALKSIPMAVPDAPSGEAKHWPDCALNHGGAECDMGEDCGSDAEHRVTVAESGMFDDPAPTPEAAPAREATCGTTHHAGCACHEARRDAALAAKDAELAKLREELESMRDAGAQVANTNLALRARLKEAERLAEWKEASKHFENERDTEKSRADAAEKRIAEAVAKFQDLLRLYGTNTTLIDTLAILTRRDGETGGA